MRIVVVVPLLLSRRRLRLRSFSQGKRFLFLGGTHTHSNFFCWRLFLGGGRPDPFWIQSYCEKGPSTTTQPLCNGREKGQIDLDFSFRKVAILVERVRRVAAQSGKIPPQSRVIVVAPLGSQGMKMAWAFSIAQLTCINWWLISCSLAEA